jgi:hypothetical protein
MESGGADLCQVPLASSQALTSSLLVTFIPYIFIEHVLYVRTCRDMGDMTVKENGGLPVAGLRVSMGEKDVQVL